MSRYCDFTVERDNMDDVHVVRCWDADLEQVEEMKISATAVKLWIKNEYDWSKQKSFAYYYNSDEWIINDICIAIFTERAEKIPTNSRD